MIYPNGCFEKDVLKEFGKLEVTYDDMRTRKISNFDIFPIKRKMNYSIEIAFMLAAISVYLGYFNVAYHVDYVNNMITIATRTEEDMLAIMLKFTFIS